AAGRDLARAVKDDVDQGVRLVHRPAGKADAELHRRQGDAFEVRARRGVELGGGGPPFGVVRRCGQTVDDRWQSVVADDLAVGGDVVGVSAVEVAAPNVESIDAEVGRDLLDDVRSQSVR